MHFKEHKTTERLHANFFRETYDSRLIDKIDGDWRLHLLHSVGIIRMLKVYVVQQIVLEVSVQINNVVD